MATRPAWYRPDNQLRFRMLVVMLSLGLLYTAFILILGTLLHGQFLIILVFALFFLGIQYFFSDKIALFAMGAHEVSEAQAPQLHDMIGRLAQQANLPKPKVAMIDTSVPNAFATGRNEHNAIVCVTTGIMQQLNPPEMEAVLAHELTHIINKDMQVMAIATFFTMLVSMISNSFFYGMLFGGFGGRRDSRDSGAAAAMIAFILSMLVYFVGTIMTLTLSRYREYAADRGSALITGAPQNLASALIKISGTIQKGRNPEKDLRQAQTVSAMCIVPAIKGDNVATIFSTHPSLEQRIAKLQQMQEQMERAPRIH